MIAMNRSTTDMDPGDEATLDFEVSDGALEAAARGPAMSLPSSPTVSIIFACCGNDVSDGR